MDETGKMLIDLKNQVEHIAFKGPCSPIEARLANALSVLISIVLHERTPDE